MVVVIDVVVFVNKGLQYCVLLDPKLKVKPKMGIPQDHFEVA